MHKYRVFIDGQAGTTGLQIQQRLASHSKIDVITIAHELRRDTLSKRALIASADVTVLCLPDDAARESAILALEVGGRILDASSAHRTTEGWIFGLPELVKGQRSAIAKARMVANPGCYSTGAILLLRPLIDGGFLSANEVWCINGITGYSGGGSQLIEKYRSGGDAYAAYALGFDHKHIPEIQMWGHLTIRPMFQPAVGNFDQGMLVFIPVVGKMAKSGVELHRKLDDYYRDEVFVKVKPFNEITTDTTPFLTPHGMKGSNNVELYVFGSKEGERSLLVAKLDNLGKGASGAAVQNLNLMLGLEEGFCTHL